MEQYRKYGGILPCGGRGARLAPLSGDRPKSLFTVSGKELIRYSIDNLPPDTIKRLVFAIDHKAEDIKAWVYAAKLPHVVQFSEQTALGVLGSIEAGAQCVQEDSIVACNTDEIRLGVNIAAIIGFHETNGTLATMVVTYADHLFRHRLIEVRDQDGRVAKTRLKPEEYKNHPDQVGLVNTGFLVIEKRAMDYLDVGHSRDWGGIIDPLCDAGQLSAYIDPEIHYFNVGTPEEYQEAYDYLRQNS